MVHIYSVHMDTGLCKYKDLFGKAGETTGLRAYRIGGIALLDVIVTMIGVYLLCLLFGWHYWITLMVVFVLGIVVHRLFCVRTAVDKMLFRSGD